ncbi:unnamed protein product [Ectocarpus sp. 12 AP-2014]
MPRLAVLISGCSMFLVLSWAMVAIRQASQPQFDSSSPTILPAAKGQKEGGVGVQREDAAKLKTRFKAPEGKDHGDRELDRNGKPKKRMGSRGISVDRKNIVETVEMDDLRAPPGRLWIPAALSGPINHDSPDNPLFNVLVAYCQLDMVAYHESPWLFAMGAFHQRTSGCMDDPSLTRTYRLSSLKRVLEENPNEFMDPTGFIYHETRCGSTLSANMIAAVPSNIVHSETPPPVAVLNLCPKTGRCPDGLREELVRTVFRLMGPVQDGHTDLFFKFQSSKFLPAIEQAWPETKWIYLFRDPLEVMSSNLKGAWRKQVASQERNMTSPAVYNLGGPCVRGAKGGGSRKSPSPESLVTTCAKHLETLNEIALTQIEEGSPNGLAVEYRQLPEVMTEYVYPEHLGMAETEEERSEFKRWMEPVTHVYSKGMATPAEGAVSKEYEQGMDLELKEEGSDPRMRAAAATMCANYRSLVELQRWRKEEQGSTMGTCDVR